MYEVHLFQKFEQQILFRNGRRDIIFFIKYRLYIKYNIARNFNKISVF